MRYKFRSIVFSYFWEKQNKTNKTGNLRINFRYIVPIQSLYVLQLYFKQFPLVRALHVIDNRYFYFVIQRQMWVSPDIHFFAKIGSLGSHVSISLQRIFMIMKRCIFNEFGVIN